MAFHKTVQYRDVVLDGECVACHAQTGKVLRSVSAGRRGLPSRPANPRILQYNNSEAPLVANGQFITDKKFVAFDIVYAAGPGSWRMR